MNGYPDSLMPSNAIDCINLNSSVNSDAMVAFFNSTVYKALLETWGRAEGGGALQLMTYEVSSIPVLDVRTLEEDTQDRLARANDRLIDGGENAQEDIDEMVINILNLNISVDRFNQLYEAMVQRRISSGKESKVMVEDIEDFDGEITKTFSRSEDGSTELSDYM